MNRKVKRLAMRAGLDVAFVAMLLPLAMALPGCSPRVGGSMSPDDALNDLRHENAELKDEVSQLEGKIELRLAEIEALMQELRAGEGAGAAVAADRPRAVTLKFARYSGGLDTNNDGRDDLVRVYLQPLDQQGRVLPVTGEATVTVARLEDGEATVLVEKKWTSVELDAAYRSGLTGTYYTLETPLPEGIAADTELAVKATLVEQGSGVKLTRQATVLAK